MGFGGSVWHASVSHPDRKIRRKVALKNLAGIGNGKLGEWHEDNNRAYHVRRRLTESEQSPIGNVSDLRGTIEGDNRVRGFLVSVSTHPMYSVIERAVKDEIGGY